MSESQPPVYGALTLRDLWEILRLPVFLALVAIALTWAVWYFTSTSCSPELVSVTGCNSSGIAQYISLDALNKMMTHAAIVGGAGGLWSYVMITRERKAREAAEKAREALAKQLTEERVQAAEERAQAAEERAQAAEERKQLLATIELLTERLAERENGGNGKTPQ